MDTCGDNFAAGEDENDARVCTCRFDMLYDVARDSCVAREHCDGYAYELDGSFRKCVPADWCAAAGKYVSVKDSEKECL